MTENVNDQSEMNPPQAADNQGQPGASAAGIESAAQAAKMSGSTADSIKEPQMSKVGISQEELAGIGLGDDAGEFDMLVNQIKPKSFEQLDKLSVTDSGKSIEMLLDVSLPVSIELGRTTMSIEEILNLGPGSIVELNKLAGEPVDLLVNDKLIAKGEVVVVDENFGIRVTSMISQQDRIKSLK